MRLAGRALAAPAPRRGRALARSREVPRKPPPAVRPLLYVFDADGTLRWTRVPGQPMPYHDGEWELMPGVAARLASVPWRLPHPRLAVASNQNAVHLGHLTVETARRLLVATVERAVGRVPEGLLVELCACDPEGDCACRKPRPGMLLRLLARSGVPADRALYVGDLEIDRRAAEAAGMPFAWAGDFFGEEHRRASRGAGTAAGPSPASARSSRRR